MKGESGTNEVFICADHTLSVEVSVCFSLRKELSIEISIKICKGNLSSQPKDRAGLHAHPIFNFVLYKVESHDSLAASKSVRQTECIDFDALVDV